jgi:alanyl-tRNA synthetase
MNSKEIRDAFVDFFYGKQHKIVSSAPMVVKDDPTLMFTNAGMNQFKDIFLGNKPANFPRIANSQKCLRVSGKHNDLEEVGHDTYHHTMFEMLGNWSFGDYFKEDAIAWAWEFLTETLKITKEHLYVTVFEGSKEDRLDADDEAAAIWKKYVPAERILYGSKKDNFWEMGESGPCGPCSEVHIDVRPEHERNTIPGKELVNTGHPLVIEIWNLVFIQYNRKANGDLEPLPNKHVDTGMGFERLCRVIQKKDSNYDIDLFQTIIHDIETICGKSYGKDAKWDIAMRVVADHIRAISFAIADGQIPSNNKAGYVIRRLLRRAVRYGYTFLGLNEPFLFKIVTSLGKAMGEAYPELISQQQLIQRVIREEEMSFLRTLDTGMRLIEQIIQKSKAAGSSTIDGKDAFVLYDTYGFPLDLTELILRENHMELDKNGFDKEMEAQKKRSRHAANVEAGDWVTISSESESNFLGYDSLEVPEVKIVRYRKVSTKGKDAYHLVFNQTPFYAESGGQVGDTGFIETVHERIAIIDTRKENNLHIHIAEQLPENPYATFTAVVEIEKRWNTQYNHSATHLLHRALREVLGVHVEQKGSLVHSEYLRFDFSHFQKMTTEEIIQIESLVNEQIRQNHSLLERREFPVEEAKKLGAMALFGEKYGDQVRVIQFGNSIELCGGTHTSSTGNIGFFKIVSEGAIAAGIRRIEAITGAKALDYVQNQAKLIRQLHEMLKNPKDVLTGVEHLIHENTSLQKQIEHLQHEKNLNIAKSLLSKCQVIKSVNFIAAQIEIENPQMLKDICFQLRAEKDNLLMVIAAEIENKAHLAVVISDSLVSDLGLNAGNIIREIAKEIDGGGGGQAFFATAGGKNPKGISTSLEKAKLLIQ